VAGLVLADNENQARALSLDGIRSASNYEEFVALIEDMVGAGVLNRADDAVPTRDELLASSERKRGLPRPLQAVLLGHTKMWAFEMLMETEFPDSEAGRPFLDEYFPRRLREGFREHLQEHTLRREIVATAAVNYLINNAGITFLERMMAVGKAGLGEVVTAYLEADRDAGAGELRRRILAAGLGAKAEQEAILEIEASLEAATRASIEGKKGDAKGPLAAVRKRLGL
jgi:glutamate dehydrogenase